MEESKKQITRDYKVVSEQIADELRKYKVVGPDNFVWATATTATGAVQGALAVGVPLRNIDYNKNYVDFNKIRMVL